MSEPPIASDASPGLELLLGVLAHDCWAGRRAVAPRYFRCDRHRGVGNTPVRQIHLDFEASLDTQPSIDVTTPTF
jgi:hypothetical protein